jgi:hypothetical protein
VPDLLTKYNNIISGHPVQEVLSILTMPMRNGIFLHVNVNPSRSDYTFVCLCSASRLTPWMICDYVTTTDPVTNAVVMHLPEKDNILTNPNVATRFPIAKIGELAVAVRNNDIPSEAILAKLRIQLLTQLSRADRKTRLLARQMYRDRMERKRSIL